MPTSIIQLMATVERPGWKWNPWKGVLEHRELRLTISVGSLAKHSVADEFALQAVLVSHELRAVGENRI